MAQFRAFVTSSGYDRHHPATLQDSGSRPVRWVSWHDGHAYARWLNEQIAALNGASAPTFADALAAGRLRVGLPSEPEWERAARSTDGRAYPWGSESSSDLANFNLEDVGDSSVVGCYARGGSPDGCEDMSGNVCEWTRSLSGDYPYPESGLERDAREDPTSTVARVLRGGAFWGGPLRVRCAPPDDGYFEIGFRVVLSPSSLDSGPSVSFR